MDKPVQLTLAIIKPHILSNPIAIKEIRQMIIASEFKVVRSKRKHLTHSEVARFYKAHESKFFYNRLVTFMASGPVDLYVLSHHDAIARWRQLLGPTKVYRSQFTDPNSIRGKFGLSDTRNAAHGSDGVESAKLEIEFFFPQFNIAKWYAMEEPAYRATGRLDFDEKAFVHHAKGMRLT